MNSTRGLALGRQRLLTLKRVAYCMVGVTAVTLGWGAGIEPRLIDERHETARLPGLPREWEGARLALIADLQVGMWLANTDTVRRVIDRVINDRPAAVLIAGDFLYHPTEETGEPREAREELESEDLDELREQIAEVVSLLQPLMTAGIATFAVLGNHDYAMRWPDSLPLPQIADELSDALRAMGVMVLRNEVLPLGARDRHRPPVSRLYVAGLDGWLHRATAVDATLVQLPDGAPRLVLMHDPVRFEELPPHSAPIALAAHTHGGQIRLPLLPHWSWMSLVREAPVAADGWIESTLGAAGNRLYVNRGIGFSVAPLRLNCPPELTWIVLEPA